MIEPRATVDCPMMPKTVVAPRLACSRGMRTAACPSRHRLFGAVLHLGKLAIVFAVFAWARPASSSCLDDAANHHGVNAALLRAIAMHESGMRADAVNKNSDGSEDVGLMQINSSHLPRLRQYGVTRSSLLDPCVSAYVGAWILRENIDRYGNTWNAVGAYNATTMEKRRAYVERIQRVLSGESSRKAGRLHLAE